MRRLSTFVCASIRPGHHDSWHVNGCNWQLSREIRNGRQEIEGAGDEIRDPGYTPLGVFQDIEVTAILRRQGDDDDQTAAAGGRQAGRSLNSLFLEPPMHEQSK